MSRHSLSDDLAEFLACVEAACAALDNVDDYAVHTGHARGLLVLHGLSMYGRDTARSAAILLDKGRNMNAGALTRIVVEHAVLAQWLRPDPETRGSLFLQQAEVEQLRWYDVVEAAEMELTERAKEHRKAWTKPKNVAPEFDTVKNLFGSTTIGNEMYLMYRNHSRYVHPSLTTFARYGSELPHGRLLSTRLQDDQNAASVGFFLASGIVMCALPYLNALGEADAAQSLYQKARDAEVITRLDIDAR